MNCYPHDTLCSLISSLPTPSKASCSYSYSNLLYPQNSLPVAYSCYLDGCSPTHSREISLLMHRVSYMTYDLFTAATLSIPRNHSRIELLSLTSLTSSYSYIHVEFRCDTYFRHSTNLYLYPHTVTHGSITLLSSLRKNTYPYLSYHNLCSATSFSVCFYLCSK